MVKQGVILTIVFLLLFSGIGCSTLLPPVFGPLTGGGGGGSKAVERIHEKALTATATAKTDKHLAVVDNLTKKAMDKVSTPEVYNPYQPSLGEKVAYTSQFVGKAIEKTAPVFPLAPLVGGGITLLGSMVASGLGWGRLMRARKMLTVAGRDKMELQGAANTLIESIENFSNDNTEAGRLLKQLIKDRSLASGTSARIHDMVKGKVS
ncbi:MAG: hypothetical protein J3T61_06605 [Candidatus Brocadiales bacterium]|nr:hypothetical protein [Candidatus Bathyanammoxibius sp.]